MIMLNSNRKDALNAKSVTNRPTNHLTQRHVSHVSCNKKLKTSFMILTYGISSVHVTHCNLHVGLYPLLSFAFRRVTSEIISQHDNFIPKLEGFCELFKTQVANRVRWEIEVNVLP